MSAFGASSIASVQKNVSSRVYQPDSIEHLPLCDHAPDRVNQEGIGEGIDLLICFPASTILIVSLYDRMIVPCLVSEY